MTDYNDDTLPPSPEEVAAGFDLTLPPTQGSGASALVQAAADREQRVRHFEGVIARPETALSDVWEESLTGTLISNAMRTGTEPDADFTAERFEGRYKEEEKAGMPAEWLETLSDAHSDAHFNWLAARARRHMENQQQLAEAGWDLQLANVGLTFFDPASMAIGVGTGALLVKGGRALLATRAGSAAVHGAAGAVGGVAVEAVAEQAGLPRDESDYLWAAGIGMSLGALYGALGKFPEEAQAFRTAGRELMVIGQRSLTVPRSGGRQVSVRRAEEATRLRRIYDVLSTDVRPGSPLDQIEGGDAARLRGPRDGEPMDDTALLRGRRDGDPIDVDFETVETPRRLPEPARGLPAPERPAEQPSAVQQAVDDIGRAINGEDTDVLTSIGRAIDEVVNPQAAEPTQPKIDEGLINTDPVAAQQKLDEIADEIDAQDSSRDFDNLPKDQQKVVRDRSADFAAWREKRAAAKAGVPKVDPKKPAKAKQKGKAGPTQEDLLAAAAWQSGAGQSLDAAMSSFAMTGRKLPKFPEVKEVFDALTAQTKKIVENLRKGITAGADDLLKEALENAERLDKLAPSPATNLSTQYIRSAARQRGLLGKGKASLQDFQDFRVPKYDPEAATWIRGEGFELAVTDGGKDVPGFRDIKNFFIKVPQDEEPVGFVSLRKKSTGWEVEEVEVIASQRGGSLASRAYNLIEKYLGDRLRPSGVLTNAGYKMWSKRDPEAVKWHRQDHKGRVWLSPKRLTFERDNNRIMDREDVAKKYDELLATLPKEVLTAKALDGMHELGVVAGRFRIKEGLRGAVQDIFDRALPKGAKGRVVDEMGPYAGYYQDGVAWAALNADNPMATAFHEVGHALRDFGLFTAKEWDMLVKEMRRIGAEKLYRIKERYSGRNLTPDEIDEEAVMHMLGDRVTGKSFGAVDAILNKTIKVLRKIRDALGIKGFRTVQDLFDDIESGAIGQRGGSSQGGPGMAAMPREAPDWLSNPFDNVEDADAAMSAGRGRFDLQGFLGRSASAATRLVSRHLFNDVVGTENHSVNPSSADLGWRKWAASYLSEYDKTRIPAFTEWHKSLGLNKYQGLARANEFYREVADYITDPNRGAKTWSAGVEKLAQKQLKLQKEQILDQKNPHPNRQAGDTLRGLKGTEFVEPDDFYLWRKYDHRQIRAAMTRYGQEEIERLFSGAIKSSQKNIDDDTLDVLSKAMVRNIWNRSAGLGDWSEAIMRADWDRIYHILRHDGSLTEEAAQRVVARLSRKQPEGELSTLKRRVLLDEFHQETLRPRDGGPAVQVTFKDLLERDARKLFYQQTRKVAGRVALARVQIRHPDGTMIVNGLNSDAEIENLLQNVQNYASARGQHEQGKLDVDRMRFGIERILGNPMPDSTSNYAAWFRLIRSYMAMRLMGQVGIAQLGEAGAAAGHLGLQSLFRHVPAYQHVLDAAGDLRNNNALLEELESMGIGVERLHGIMLRDWDEIGDNPFDAPRSPWLDRVTDYARMGEQATYEVSGMSFIQQRQEMWVAANMANKIANMAAKIKDGKTLGRGDVRRLAQLGIDEAMMARIMRQFEHTDQADGVWFGKKLNRLNLQKWTDGEARATFENALFRATRKIIQSQDEGSAAIWMHGDLMKTIFQFRGYAFTAWANQTLYSFHMRDAAALTSFATGMAWAAAIRAAQVSILASTRSDKDEFKEKHLDPWELAKSSFQRTGASSVLPMVIDSFLGVAGQEGAFNARTTGQASNAIFGSPAVSFIDSASKGIGGAVNSIIEGRDMSQAEIRAAVGVAPFSNLFPIAAGLSYMIKDRDERAPKEFKY